MYKILSPDKCQIIEWSKLMATTKKKKNFHKGIIYQFFSFEIDNLQKTCYFQSQDITTYFKRILDLVLRRLPMPSKKKKLRNNANELNRIEKLYTHFTSVNFSFY